MISIRTGTRAIIITTNLPFTRWEEIIKDKVLCSALVDRLCHKANTVNMTGQSYRVRETQKMLKSRFSKQTKLIGRGTPSGKGRDHPSRRATKIKKTVENIGIIIRFTYL